LSEFIGLLVSTVQGVRYGLLHTKILERDKFKALCVSLGDYKATAIISPEGKNDIQWWIDNIFRSSRPISIDHFDIEISTDASSKKKQKSKAEQQL